jgi:hypothetical protein
MDKYEIKFIISGGQTGVDRAALDFALANNIPCGGWCPKNRRAEDGEIPAQYPLTETSTDKYPQRTRKNVQDSDATLIITNGAKSRGTKLTAETAQKQQRPYLIINPDKDSAINLLKWLQEIEPQTLNIAGPRYSENPLLEEFTRSLLNKCLTPSADKIRVIWPPHKIETPDLFGLD